MAWWPTVSAAVADLARFLPATAARSDDWHEGWRAGMEAAGWPTIGAARRLRGHLLPQDPQTPTIRAVAAEVESIRRALAAGARADELRARLLRALAVLDGEAVGELAGDRWAA
jgi:hypothetical protein